MNETVLHPDLALRIVQAEAPRLPVEDLALAEALGRCLPVSLPARIDQPPFDKSGMDGFAHGEPPGDAGAFWRVVETVAAGYAAERRLGPGECARIMTGAPIPAGAIGVQRIEWTEEPGADLVRFTRPETVDNIIRRGENQRAGEELLGPRRLGPQDLGLLASSGYDRVPVSARPRVAVVSTGDELVPAGSALGPASIWDSNGPALVAQARAAGCEARLHGPVRDEPAALRKAFEDALADADVVVASGGVSMGDFDHVPAALAALGFRAFFHGLTLRPGKPTLFARAGGKTAFGLPGNPVSTFVNFELLVLPHLLARCGVAHRPVSLRIPLAEPLVRRGSDRVEYRPGRLETGPGGSLARPLAYKGSSMLAILAEADCLLRMDSGVERLEKGELVDARLVRA